MGFDLVDCGAGRVGFDGEGLCDSEEAAVLVELKFKFNDLDSRNLVVVVVVVV